MKIIPKEKSWFGYGYSSINSIHTYYCFEHENNNYLDGFLNQYTILSNITVNEKNEIHSYNDKPLVYKDELQINKLWFQNGIIKRENPEKPYLVELKKCFYVKIGFAEVSINNVIKNLKSLKTK
jgi:hypothetical protein